ncbi:MAG: hypothetical protein ACR2KZ_14650 [Segetibacter sp.]
MSMSIACDQDRQVIIDDAVSQQQLAIDCHQRIITSDCELDWVDGDLQGVYREELRIFQYPRHAIFITLAWAPKRQEAVAARIHSLIEQLPIALGDAVHRVYVPRKIFGESARLEDTVAFCSRQNIFFWPSSSEHSDDDVFEITVLAHEAAHAYANLTHNNDGYDLLPSGVEKAWATAQKRDKRHALFVLSQGVARSISGSNLTFGQMLRRFPVGSRWVSSYAQGSQKDCEDWAEAVGFWVASTVQNNGILAVINDGEHARTQWAFKKLYPHRTRILERTFRKW